MRGHLLGVDGSGCQSPGDVPRIGQSRLPTHAADGDEGGERGGSLAGVGPGQQPRACRGGRRGAAPRAEWPHEALGSASPLSGQPHARRRP